MPSIAVVVLARNEEANITECLQTVAWADERYVVLDTRTTDRTAELSRSAGATVMLNAFVNFAAQRDAALRHVEADWIFFVDADERGTPELATECRMRVLDESKAGWWVPRRNYIWGQWIRHAGWYPDYQLRLLRRGRARYDPERQVHETVILDGADGWLDTPLIHHNYSSVRQFIGKQSDYARYESAILRKRTVAVRPHSVITQPLREFWRRYVFLQGYRDGWRGLLLSVLMAYFAGVAHWRAVMGDPRLPST